MLRLKLYNPVKRVLITQGFGLSDTDPIMLEKYKAMGISAHNGLDMMAFDGTPVYATHDGRVTFAGYDGSGGLGIVIRTNEEVEMETGISYAKTLYWHLKKDSLLVTGGQQVVRGQQIASADNTGFSTGSHLHFGLKPIARGENDWTWFNTEQNNGFGGAIDPRPYFVKFQNEMNLGDQSQDVRDLQEFLKTLGYFSVQPTGFYGKITMDSIFAFQKANCKLSWYERNIMRGNKVGPKTLEKLNELSTT